MCSSFASEKEISMSTGELKRKGEERDTEICKEQDNKRGRRKLSGGAEHILHAEGLRLNDQHFHPRRFKWHTWEDAGRLLLVKLYQGR